MAPYQTTVMLDDTRDGQDVVEVQILPQVIIWCSYLHTMEYKFDILFILLYTYNQTFVDIII